MPDAEPSGLYRLVKDVINAVLLGSAQAALLAMLDAPLGVVVVAALGGPAACFLGRRLRRRRRARDGERVTGDM